MRYVRVYNDGSMVVDNPSNQKDWIEYNKNFRFGVALFIDGECVQAGYLTKERCESISNMIKEKLKR